MEDSAVKNKLKIKRDVQNICSSFGLYGNVVSYSPTKSLSDPNYKYYIVASPEFENITAVLPDNIKPDEIVSRNKIAEEILFTECWAWDLTEGNRHQALTELVRYCRGVEFLQRVCAEFVAPLPKKIRITEINDLIVFYKAYVSTKYLQNSEYRFAEKTLKEFFAKEKSRNIFTRRWMDYYRSERYPTDKGSLAALICFFSNKQINRKCPEGYQTLEMGEHEYKEFSKLMKKYYPEVEYRASGIKEMYTGGLGMTDPSTNPPTEYVTNEDFAAVMNKWFAVEGWNCINHLKVCYWANRIINFKLSDEPAVASVFNYISLQYSNPVYISKIKADNKFSVHKIYKPDFMNFVVEATNTGLNYAIDFKGEYEKPSLEFVTVITKTDDDDIIYEIVDSNIEFMAKQRLAYDNSL